MIYVDIDGVLVENPTRDAKVAAFEDFSATSTAVKRRVMTSKSVLEDRWLTYGRYLLQDLIEYGLRPRLLTARPPWLREPTQRFFARSGFAVDVITRREEQLELDDAAFKMLHLQANDWLFDDRKKTCLAAKDASVNVVEVAWPLISWWTYNGARRVKGRLPIHWLDVIATR